MVVIGGAGIISDLVHIVQINILELVVVQLPFVMVLISDMIVRHANVYQIAQGRHVVSRMIVEESVYLSIFFRTTPIHLIHRRQSPFVWAENHILP